MLTATRYELVAFDYECYDSGMKKLTCRDLGGPCDEEITGNSFDEISNNCRTHVMEQINSGDEAHRAAAGKMKDATPEQQKSWMADFERRYNEAPDI